MPALSPSACLSACPSVMPMSSTVWWSSMCKSPRQVMSRSIRLWRLIWSSMCSRKGTPVSNRLWPVPSRLMDTVIWVSLVWRLTVALRVCAASAAMASAASAAAFSAFSAFSSLDRCFLPIQPAGLPMPFSSLACKADWMPRPLAVSSCACFSRRCFS